MIEKMAAAGVSGLGGSTHERKSGHTAAYIVPKQCAIGIFKFWHNAFLYYNNKCFLKQKRNCKHEYDNYTMAVLTTCCILVLMSGLFICDVPTNAGKNTNRAATADQDPFGIWGEKAKLYFFGFGYATIFSHTSAVNEAPAPKRLNQRNRMSKQRHAPPRVIKTLILLLLLSGDVHLNPGPLRKADISQNIVEQQYQANESFPGVNLTTNVLSLIKNEGEMGHHFSQVDALGDVFLPAAGSVWASGHLGVAAGEEDGAVAGAAVLGPQRMRGLDRGGERCVGARHPVPAAESRSTGVYGPDSDGAAVSLDLHSACNSIDDECKHKSNVMGNWNAWG